MWSLVSKSIFLKESPKKKHSNVKNTQPILRILWTHNCKNIRLEKIHCISQIMEIIETLVILNISSFIFPCIVNINLHQPFFALYG